VRGPASREATEGRSSDLARTQWQAMETVQPRLARLLFTVLFSIADTAGLPCRAPGVAPGASSALQAFNVS
jgi:hypothetical protein